MMLSGTFNFLAISLTSHLYNPPIGSKSTPYTLQCHPLPWKLKIQPKNIVPIQHVLNTDICWYCGNQIGKDYRFCAFCGTRL